MQYKCVPESAGFTNMTKDDAARAYADIINRESIGGWKFHSVQSANITHEPGCIAGLLGKSKEYEPFNMLIFCNENLNAPTGNVFEGTQSDTKPLLRDVRQPTIVSEDTVVKAKCKNCSKKIICEELFKDTEMSFDENSCCENYESFRG